jgi:hypothetical protein
MFQYVKVYKRTEIRKISLIFHLASEYYKQLELVILNGRLKKNEILIMWIHIC